VIIDSGKIDSGPAGDGPKGGLMKPFGCKQIFGCGQNFLFGVGGGARFSRIHFHVQSSNLGQFELQTRKNMVLFAGDNFKERHTFKTSN